jgi:type I restriction enzyme S subunit
MTKWHSVTVGDLVSGGLADIRTGPFGTQLRASDYSSDGVPVLNVRNLGYGRTRTASVERVDAAVQKRLAGHVLAAGDIVFGRKGAVDRHALINHSESGWMQGSDCIRLRLLPGAPISAGFLSKALMTPSHYRWMQAQCSHGATMASLNQEIVSRISLSIPRVGVQRRILAVLAAFDELIEINERRIELLEELARSLYREWFVRFRFPGHDDADIGSVMRGDVPEGWSLGSLGDVAQNLDRLRRPLSKPARAERQGPFPYYGAAKLIDSIDGWIFEGEHLLFAEDGTVQTRDGCPVLQLVTGRFWANNHTHILKGTILSTRFLYVAASRYPVAGHVTGAAQPKITQANLNRIPVVIAPEPVRTMFDDLSRPVFDEIHLAKRMIVQLAATRDLLLPRLVTGRLDIADIDLGDLLPAEAA